MQWILAILGFIFFRVPGAVIGFIIGYLFKNTTVKVGGGGFTNPFQDAQQQGVSPADFEVNLLSLCSLVIKANGSHAAIFSSVKVPSQYACTASL